MTFMGRVRCDCGGEIEITSHPITGRTIETCHGCGYHGAPRPPNEQPTMVGRGHYASDSYGPGLCVEGCGQLAYSTRAKRCYNCNKAHRSRRRACVEGCGRQAQSATSVRCRACTNEQRRKDSLSTRLRFDIRQRRAS